MIDRNETIATQWCQKYAVYGCRWLMWLLQRKIQIKINFILEKFCYFEITWTFSTFDFAKWWFPYRRYTPSCFIRLAAALGSIEPFYEIANGNHCSKTAIQFLLNGFLRVFQYVLPQGLPGNREGIGDLMHKYSFGQKYKYDDILFFLSFFLRGKMSFNNKFFIFGLPNGRAGMSNEKMVKLWGKAFRFENVRITCMLSGLDVIFHLWWRPFTLINWLKYYLSFQTQLSKIDVLHT